MTSEQNPPADASAPQGAPPLPQGQPSAAPPPPYVPPAPAAAPPPYVPAPTAPTQPPAYHPAQPGAYPQPDTYPQPGAYSHPNAYPHPNAYAQPGAYPQPVQQPGQPVWGPQPGQTGPYLGAPQPEQPRKSHKGLWLGLGLGAAALVIGGGALAIYLVLGNAQAEDRLAAAQELSSAEQDVVRTAVNDASSISLDVYNASFTYQEAALDWADAEAGAAQFQASNDTPSLEAANPGGSLPDGYGRDLLASIGAGDVQVMLDAGEQNCGFDPRGADWIAVGGCYNPTYRDWFFLAWEPGTTDAALWSIFVHEAMHWQQWDQLSTIYQSAAGAGITQDQYRKAVESDASCRAVYQHGVPIEDYVSSSSPCDVDGWTPSYLPDYLAGLGVPMAAPDPEAYEVQEVIRP